MTLAKAWVAIAPAFALAHGTSDPTARNFDATATPHSGPAGDDGSHAAIENVTQSKIARAGRSVRRAARGCDKMGR